MSNPELDVVVVARPFVCYVLDKMGNPPILGVHIKNNSDHSLKDIRIAFSSDSGTVEPISIAIDEILAGDEVSSEPEVRLADKNLIQATEGYEETVRIDITIAGQAPKQGLCRCIIATSPEETTEATSFDMDVLPFDQWVSFVPESIAYFVTPNHPAITSVVLRASEILGEWTGTPSLEGYQFQDSERVRKMAGAVFQAIREQGIVYTEPPATFRGFGQRIRSAGDVLTGHLGTCIDLAALYASCLEAIGLNPFVVIVEGHAFAGAWLEEKTFPEIVEDDPSQLVNRLSAGMNQMLVAECTCLCNDKSMSFDDACNRGRENLLSEGDYIGCVDIVRARRAGITPIPARVMGNNGWEIQAPKANAKLNTAAPSTRTVSTAFIDETSEGKLTKRDLWERSLLDLTLRNNLLNMRIGSRLMPLAAPSLDELEDALADGTSLAINPKPREWGKVEPAFELVAFIGEQAEFLNGEFKSKRLRTFLTEGELTKNVTNLYRASTLSLEETGSNTLYMSFGALRWLRPNDSSPHYAPLVMIPVEIIRKSTKKGYALVVRDEDPQINVSLLEMLRRDFGIDIGGLDPLPLDQHGIDTRKIFNTFKHKIIGQTQWEVLEVACLGIFSFSQFVMWDDIHSHEAELRRSPVVASLLDGHLTWNAQPMIMPEKVEQEDTLLAVEADASQLFAIKEAVTDKSFVLHGPPGTGKSQVITGLIANALMHDKRVLFVSEKAAALNVVERRLDKLGIGKVCIELHSNKANKAHVLDQLQQASEMRSNASPKEYAAQLAAVRRLKAELDEYAGALYEENEAGLTLREQICRYEQIKDEELPDINIPREYLSSLSGKTSLEDDVRIVERFAAATSEIDDPSSHPLKRVMGSEYSHAARFELVPALDALESSLSSLGAQSSDVASALERPVPATYGEWVRLIQEISSSFSAPDLPALWAAQPNPSALLDDIVYAMGKKYELEGVSAANPNWVPAFFQLNAATLEAEWEQAQAAGLFKKKKAIEAVVNKVASYSMQPISEHDIPRAVATLREYESKRNAFKSRLEHIAPFISDFSSFDGYDWNAVSKAIAKTRESITSGVLSSPIRKALYIKLASDPILAARCKDLLAAWENALAARTRVEAITGVLHVSPSEHWIATLSETATSLRDNQTKLQEWMRWRAAAQAVEQRGLASVVECIMAGSTAETLPRAFEKSLYRTMCSVSLSKHKGVASFSGVVFEEEVSQFAEASNKLLELSRKELQLHLASKVPNLTLAAQNGSEAAILNRAIRSKGRGVSIRSLFSSIPTLIKGLAPCVLMSPLSVAQYLDFTNEPFDLVVFDEASQLQTCKAVGALARAKNAIVVGDPNQMPPTAFFSSQMNDDELSDIADMESILDDCLAIGMPETYLQWHYRSQHESLISFSNAQFYQSKMCTFPSADDSASRVQLVHVAGYYEGGGQNSFEGKAIIEEIKRRYKESNGSAQSLGVITFNVKQQSLIEDLLDKEYMADPALESWALSGSEPLFVKNLENVQGDERDTILFSITYAPDENSKMAMRFGPVNSEGGWRRLNVAVTRARREMVLFSTLEPEQIDLARTSSKGVRALKSFLEFARRGRFIGASALSPNEEDSIAAQVCKRLGEKGYEVKRNIGSSAYKVDLAIPGAMPEDGYLAGILLDGASYGRARSTRDREVSRDAILKTLGWRIFHVWSIDWWANSDKVMTNLFAFLEKAKEEAALTPSKRATVGTLAAVAPSNSSASVNSSKPTTGVGADAQRTVKPVGESAAVHQEKQATPATEDAPKPAPCSVSDILPATAPERKVAAANKQESGALKAAEVDISPIDDADKPRIEVIPYPYTQLPAGPILSYDEYATDHEDLIIERFQALIEAEAPIEKTRLCNRVRESFGLSRSSPNVQARNNEILKKVKHREVKRGDEVFIWQKGADPKSFRQIRLPDLDKMPESNEICDEEIICLLALVLEESGPMPRESLIRAAVMRYGYKRVTARMKDIFMSAVTKAKRRKMIAENSGMMVLPNE